MASKAKDTIIVRLPVSTKWAARRAATADKITMTEYISRLIWSDAEKRAGNGAKQ
jgi:hypothetical protein